MAKLSCWADSNWMLAKGAVASGAPAWMCPHHGMLIEGRVVLAVTNTEIVDHDGNHTLRMHTENHEEFRCPANQHSLVADELVPLGEHAVLYIDWLHDRNRDDLIALQEELR